MLNIFNATFNYLNNIKVLNAHIINKCRSIAFNNTFYVNKTVNVDKTVNVVLQQIYIGEEKF